ncbi:hypothetical protein [Oceanobacillus timonensis]|uniref:hypothetical protein n=1 Tax=Oceanobacillus timonensis TaxID=1926285 RepID=UPI001FE9DF13|nr:hypothetical protein [Oceanobacillus timonensis]
MRTFFQKQQDRLRHPKEAIFTHLDEEQDALQHRKRQLYQEDDDLKHQRRHFLLNEDK